MDFVSEAKREDTRADLEAFSIIPEAKMATCKRLVRVPMIMLGCLAT